MPFHKHPVNFDVCKYLTHCSGLRSSWSASPSPVVDPHQINGSGRSAKANVVLLDGSTIETVSLYVVRSNDLSNNTGVLDNLEHFVSVWSHLLDSVKYFFMTPNSKNAICKYENGQLNYDTGYYNTEFHRAILGNYSYFGHYGSYAYYQGATKILAGLTSEDFSDEKNDYTLIQGSSSEGSYIYTDILFNSNNGNTQLRINFTVTVASDTTIKGLALYTITPKSSGGCNIFYIANGEPNYTGTVQDLYMINIGYVEFDTPIDAKTNIPFTVDVIFEFET